MEGDGSRLCPVQWAAGHAVVALPEQFRAPFANLLSSQFVAVISGGARALIADLTQTVACDTAGVNALIRAHSHCVIRGVRFRVVAGQSLLRRDLKRAGLPPSIPVYFTLAQAMTGGIPSVRFWPAAGYEPGTGVSRLNTGSMAMRAGCA